jgi:antitoxin (DNA-binding transcriptional repressor) of toxin-antitoxin stability system
MEKMISVMEAARNFAECVNRAHYNNVTFVLMRNGSPVARIVPDRKKGCTGPELAEALADVDLSKAEARAWHKELRAARKALRPPRDRWR